MLSFQENARCKKKLINVNFIGPTVSSPNDPYVLVGTAHCNYICKGRHPIKMLILRQCPNYKDHLPNQ